MNEYCKCSRCRNIHAHSERNESRPDKYGFRELLCPRCGAKSFYKVDSAGKTGGQGGEA